MVADANWTTICPHCGAASEDDAICRACGKLLDVSQPVRPFSSERLVAKLMASWTPATEDEIVQSLKEEPEFTPSWRMYQGNIYHRQK